MNSRNELLQVSYDSSLNKSRKSNQSDKYNKVNNSNYNNID